MGEFRKRLFSAAARFDPGNFAFVMATGITSIGAYHLGMGIASSVLFRINEIAFVAASSLLLARSFLSPAGVLKGIFNYQEAPFFATVVAGTCIMGSQMVTFENNAAAGAALWIAGTFLWLILLYAFLVAVMTGSTKPPVESSPDAGWLIFVVATQSISILGISIGTLFPHHDIILVAMLALHSVGVMLYMILMALIFHRLFFFPLAPEDLTPLYWIVMGAAAITTLSGAEIIREGGKLPFLASVLPFFTGSTFFSGHFPHGGFRSSPSYIFGGTSPEATRCPTTCATGGWYFHWACIRSVPTGSEQPSH